MGELITIWIQLIDRDVAMVEADGSLELSRELHFRARSRISKLSEAGIPTDYLTRSVLRRQEPQARRRRGVLPSPTRARPPA